LDLREHRVEIAPARALRRAEESDVLGEERDDDELPREVVRALSRSVEHIPPRPPALALRWREEHELDAPLSLGSIDLDPHPPGRRAPAHHLGVVVRSRRIATRGEVDRLEEIRLPRSVGADEGGRSACEREIEFRVRTEVVAAA